MTRSSLATQLERLGVIAGDRLMVHASMRAIGGSAEAVVAAVDEVLGCGGTWMMTLGAADDWAWVNERPEHERVGLLDGSPAFDCATTRAEPEVGVLAEVFRTTPGTVVSDHPEGRFGARGPLAGEWLGDVPWNDYYGAGSPLERFVRAGGRVLRLGADDNTVTLLHYAEYLAPIPNKSRVRRHRMVNRPDGPRVVAIETLDDSAGIAAYRGVAPDDDEFAIIVQQFRAQVASTSGVVGGAVAELFDGRSLVDFGVAWITANALAVGGA